MVLGFIIIALYQYLSELTAPGVPENPRELANIQSLPVHHKTAQNNTE